MFALYFEFTFWFVFQKNCRDFVIIFLSFNFLSFLWKPHCFVLNLSLVVQFSRTIFCRSLEFLSCATWILYHILCRLSRGFAKVFLIFFNLSFALAWRDLYIISYSFAFVKRFLKSFSKFFRFALFVVLSLTALILYHILHRLSRGFRKKIEKISSFFRNVLFGYIPLNFTALTNPL